MANAVENTPDLDYADKLWQAAGLFVQSEQFVKAHGENTRDISIYGQESNPTTWGLAHMNLAIFTNAEQDDITAVFDAKH